MASLDDYVFQQFPGSSEGKSRPASPRSNRLIEGIKTDDVYLKNNHCHMAMVDYAVRNVDRFNEGDNYMDKYKRLLPREKLIFQALLRRAAIKTREYQRDPMWAPPPMDKPPVRAYSRLADILPEDREVYRGRLSRLLVVKIVNFTDQSFESELMTVVGQLKVLNELYSTDIPLLLVSNYYNNNFVEMVCKKYHDKDLTIHVLKQPLFPLINRVVDSVTSEDLSTQMHYYFSVSTKGIKEENTSTIPQQLPDWYTPGVVFTLCEQVKRHPAAKEKENILLLNSVHFENVVDIKILNYMCDSRGRRIDVLFEVIKPSESELSNDDCEFFVKSEGSLKVLPKRDLLRSRYDIGADGLMITRNMWINMNFLRSEESDTTLLKIVSADYFVVDMEATNGIRLELPVGSLFEGAFCEAVEVPAKRVIAGGWFWDKLNPTWTQKLKLKQGFTYLLWSLVYHGVIYFMTAGLHEWYGKSDRSKTGQDGGRKEELKVKEQELGLFWIENSIWLGLVFIYFLILTSRRRRMAHRSRSPQQRDRRALGDFYHAILLGSTRFLYAGLNKTAETREWFDGNFWLYLIVLHSLSALFEVVGAVLIMVLVDPPNLMEPLETA